MIHQDAYLYAGLFEGTEEVEFSIATGRLCYVHIAQGNVLVNGQSLGAGDAMKLTGVSNIHIEQGSNAEVLVFDLP